MGKRRFFLLGDALDQPAIPLNRSIKETSLLEQAPMVLTGFSAVFPCCIKIQEASDFPENCALLFIEEPKLGAVVCDVPVGLTRASRRS
jgi:hypothetical protein